MIIKQMTPERLTEIAVDSFSRNDASADIQVELILAYRTLQSQLQESQDQLSEKNQTNVELATKYQKLILECNLVRDSLRWATEALKMIRFGTQHFDIEEVIACSETVLQRHSDSDPYPKDLPLLVECLQWAITSLNEKQRERSGT